MENDPLVEHVSRLFRMAYRQGTCDPDNCSLCDCHLDDALREMIHTESSRLAQEVVVKVRADQTARCIGRAELGLLGCLTTTRDRVIKSISRAMP